MLSKEQTIELENKIKETVGKLNNIYNFNLPTPQYYFDVQGTTAGIAKKKSQTIHFNEKLALQNWRDFIDNTVPHEICHLGVWMWASFFHKPTPKPHGACWKLMMREVGAKPTRTHEYDVSEVKKNMKLYEYECGCDKKTTVSSIIHNRILKGRKYKCLTCNKTIENGTRKLTKYFSKPSPNGTTNQKV